MAFNSPRLGSLMDPLGKIMQPDGSPAVPTRSGSAPMVRDTGQSMPNATVGQQVQPPQGGQDFEAKVERNKGFLSSPEVQAGLMQFGLNLLAGGDVGSSLGAGAEAIGRVATNRDEQDIIDRKMNLAERGMNIQEDQQTLEEQKFGLEKYKQRKAADALMRRELLFKQAGPNGEGVAGMASEDLLDLGGELIAVGDLDGAKTVIDLANSQKAATSTNDIREYDFYVKQATAAGETPEAFRDWQTKKIESGVPKPVQATAEMSPQMQEEGNKVSAHADELANTLPEYQLMLDVAKEAKTGALVPYTKPVQEFLLNLGLSATPDSNNQVRLLEVMQAQQNKLALKMRNPASGFGLTGGTSDNDILFLKAAGPGLAQTPQTNVVLAIFGLSKARRDAELEGMKSDWIWEHKTLDGWRAFRNKWVKENSMFKPEEQELLDRIAGGGKRPPQVESGPPKSAQQIPAAPPDSLSEEDKRLWPHMDDADKRLILGLPPQ